MQKLVVAATLTIGAALLAGGLVQVYYSGLSPSVCVERAGNVFVPRQVSFVYRVVVVRVALISNP